MEGLAISQPRSRNDKLASLMRRLKICEERGTGIDKVVDAVESFALPAPVFEKPPGFTRALLFAHKPLRDMDRQERLHACYMHACLRYVTQQPMTNSSLRARFGIADVLHLVADRYRVAARQFAPAVIRYYLTLARVDAGMARRLNALSRSRLATGRCKKDLRLRIPPELRAWLRDVAVATEGATRSAMVLSVLLAPEGPAQAGLPTRTRRVRRRAARRASGCGRRSRRLRGGSRCGRRAGSASPRPAAGAGCRMYATARCRCP